MTSVNAQYRAFIANMRRITGLGVDEMGSAPDERHLAGGGYHVGPDDIRRIGRWLTDYSTRQVRDRIGGNDASAFDVGDDWPRGGRAAWLRFNGLFLRQLQARDPALAAVRAINFSPDGKLCRRFDTFNRAQGVITSTDSVYMHTHGETWRDQAGTPALDRAFRRIEQMADAAVRNIPLPPEGDDMAFIDDPVARTLAYREHCWASMVESVKTPQGETVTHAGVAAVKALQAAAAADEARDTATLAAVRALAVATGADPQPILDAIAAARDDAHAGFVALQRQLADVQARNARLAAALAAAGGALDEADDTPAA